MFRSIIQAFSCFTYSLQNALIHSLHLLSIESYGENIVLKGAR